MTLLLKFTVELWVYYIYNTLRGVLFAWYSDTEVKIMSFIPNDKEPVYIQIIRYIKQQIVIGELGIGDIIPSRRDMAVMIKVNPNTVQKAYKEMEEMGIITTHRNYQSNITDDSSIITKIKEDLINESMDSFIASMKAINVKKEEVINIINNRF